MAKAYSLIQAQTLTSNVSSVTFSNIPQNFTDLVLYVSARSSRATSEDGLGVQVNGVTTNYNYKTLIGNGSSLTNLSTNYENWWASELPASTATSNVFSNDEIYFSNYTSANAKTYLTVGVAENNASLGYIAMGANLQSSTAAITSLTLLAANGNLVSGSTFYLYGVGGARATGGTITADTDYTYHTFTSSGLFTPLEKITNAEYLLIAGGGGGGTARGGGGGAGGVYYIPGQTLQAGTAYTALVGAAGAAGSGAGSESGTNGGNGGNSVFEKFVAIGGGGGQTAAVGTATPPAGGSGGGASLWNFSPGGLGTAGQGFNGGGSIGWTSSGSSGGGGGSGGTPPTSTVYKSGDGGPGTTVYSRWAYATGTGVNGAYAGGGGGGADGSTMTPGIGQAGGGSGGVVNTYAATAAQANTGSGGGGGGRNSGSGTTYNGAAGGSGLVIIRYPNTN